MKKIGKCHLCGKQEKLTFEHIPPQKANNNKRVHAIIGDTLMQHIGGVKKPWELSGLRYKNMQRGMGGYTLCESCNNLTGEWYARDYTNFANIVGYLLNNKINVDEIQSFGVQIENMYPLRIIKQILCMFVSTMHPEFLDANEELRKFILDKNSTNLDKTKYRISMYTLKEQKIQWSGLNAMITGKNVRTVAFMDLYPLGFVLELEPKEENFKYVQDITNLATDYDYNFRGTVYMQLNILERNTLYPCDFRSKKEIETQIEESKLNMVKNIKEQMKKIDIEEELYNDFVEQYLNDEISASELFYNIDKIKRGES